MLYGNNNVFDIKNGNEMIMKEFEIKNDINKIKDDSKIIRKNKINNILIRYYTVFFIIKLLIINIFCQIKCNILFNLYSSSNITLKIKGIGENTIFGNHPKYRFKKANFPQQIRVNGKTKETKEYKYYFDKLDNIVELIWDNNIIDCSYMFYGCSNITEINFYNFDTSNVTSMSAMFCGCTSLTSLNLSNFDTSQVTNMLWMFYNCILLTSLDLSNFNTSQLQITDNMFKSCINLDYINLKNFDESKLSDDRSQYQYMFLNTSENIVICINESKTQSKIFPQIKGDIPCYVIDCADNWKSKQNKIINNVNNNDKCIQSCDNSSIYKYEYNGKCYENCSNGFLLDEYNNNTINKCKCEYDECLLCPKEALSIKLCTKCNTNYYPKENDPLNIGMYIKCYKNPEGYYLDNDIYKQCYYTCKACNMQGNNITHNCIKCNDNYSIEIMRNKYYNCENCSYYHYFDDENKLHCTLNLSCPDDYPKLNEDKMECIKINNIENIKDNLIIKEKNETEKMSKKEEIEYYDNLIKIIEKGFTQNYDTSNMDKGHDDIIKTEKITVTLTTVQNQKNDENKNMTSIDLEECENQLRNYYNISSNETLYMRKIDIVQEGFSIPKVEYDVYSKLNGSNLIKLNLTVCQNSKIRISIPIEIVENIDKLNSSSGYYNDICYTTTSEDGTDITLKDRKSDFVNKNMAVCQEDCVLKAYDNQEKRVECVCNVKEASLSLADMKINKAKLFENFKNIKNIANFDFLICYKKLFKKDGIKNNIGSYLILTIILFQIISVFVFYINEFSLIKKKISVILLGMNEEQVPNKNEKDKKDKKNESKIKSSKISIYNKKKKKSKRKNKKKNIESISDNSNRKIISKFNKNNKNIEKPKNLSEYIVEEINDLSYDLAIQIDQRVFCQYYNSLIKTKHSLIFALFNNNDYNSKIIKIDLFFIGFTIDYIVNALFYNDDTMHKIYENKGYFDFESQIPIIVYSSLISMILNAPLNMLSLSNDAIINFKQEKEKIDIMKKAKNLEHKLFIKFILYFLISFLFLFFFWYYIAMFGVIYRNTQIHLLKDTLMSLVLSLFIPFVYNLLPGLFRIYALSDKKNKKQCLYNFSKFLQSF